MKIGVVGSGIGGLAAALSLLARGFDVQVYEQARELGAVGAGIQISPNATRILHRLGLAEALERVGVKPLARVQRRWQDGRILLRSELGTALAQGFGAPYYHFHRADLIGVLAAAMPRERVHLGHRLAGVIELGDAVEARFESGEAARLDVLVGADGIHSAVRTGLFGPDSPRFTGCVAYRGLVPAERLSHLGLEVTAENYMGPGGHFVHYFVAGGRLVNFVAVLDRNSWTSESWTDRGRIEDALAAYVGWHPRVRSIIGAADETFIWALFDRAPLPRWSAGRVTLLGDACHAMLPFMAQGAAQGIEDGATLAACLAQAASPQAVSAALVRYEALRKPRTSRLQALSAANKTRFHLPDGPQQAERDARLALGDTNWSSHENSWLYGHEAGEA